MNKNVSTVILGATSESQIEENLSAIHVARKMTKKHMEEINKIIEPTEKELENEPICRKVPEVGYFGREMKNFIQCTN